MINILEQLLKQQEEHQARFHEEMQKLEQRKAAFAEGVAVRHAELHEAMASLQRTLREADQRHNGVFDQILDDTKELNRINSLIEENDQALKNLLDEI